MYVELHLHTAWSFLDGASLPAEMIERAVELGYQRLALTDHNGLHGAMEFAQAAKSAGLRAITGAELTIEDGSHITLLVESPQEANLATDQRLLRWRPAGAMGAEVLRHTTGLILLTGCREGEVAQLVDARQPLAALAVLNAGEWFGRRMSSLSAQQNLRMATFAHGGWRNWRTRPAALCRDRNVLPRARAAQVQDVLVAVRNRTTLDARIPCAGPIRVLPPAARCRGTAFGATGGAA
jgi:error-prone DNA polymerase